MKDLVDLVSTLRNERRDAWISPWVDKFQTHISAIQSELLEIGSANLDLKRQIFQMEQDHAKAVSSRDAKILKLESELADAKLPQSGTVNLTRR